MLMKMLTKLCVKVVPKRLIQIHVRHICPAVAQQLGHIQLCPVLCSPAIQRFPILPGRIAVPHPVVSQRLGVGALIRTALPKEFLERMDIGIRGRIVRNKQLMPTLDCGSQVTQRSAAGQFSFWF